MVFLDTMVDERRAAFLAEADRFRLARLARLWRKGRREPPRIPVPPPVPHEKSAVAGQCRAA
ncbi:hypothetical protein LWC35_06685 [Pseudonocardia kujensis]|uniref:hypothetical protein n=1 Tax=Pseudonocardia kujensis TaxID=1128675 RepID=UPI001E4929EC|nr:hypothetical protein [Pseudonocardia kujensis]MCE0762594.1 hypothetical protein [Pseudonocardia kujensis]